MMARKLFRVWACGCSHISTDLKLSGRESLAEAIKDPEKYLRWHIALHLGDITGGQTPPQDEEGRAFLRQLRALREHNREHI